MTCLFASVEGLDRAGRQERVLVPLTYQSVNKAVEQVYPTVRAIDDYHVEGDVVQGPMLTIREPSASASAHENKHQPLHLSTIRSSQH